MNHQNNSAETSDSHSEKPTKTSFAKLILVSDATQSTAVSESARKLTTASAVRTLSQNLSLDEFLCELREKLQNPVVCA